MNSHEGQEAGDSAYAEHVVPSHVRLIDQPGVLALEPDKLEDFLAGWDRDPD
jgi:hypothetical protein